MKRGMFNIILGAQAGSESKGKAAAFLAEKFKPEIICMAASPNAGHSVILDGDKFVTYHLPVSWVAHRDATMCLGPTSVIYLPILLKEIEALKVPPEKLKIHPRAVMIREHYMREERDCGLLKIGSTNQGVGVARRDKVMRVDDITRAESVRELHKYIDDTVSRINTSLAFGGTVLCEMTQGFDLDLEHGIDPHYCTSKMINPMMGMAEAGVPLKYAGDVYGVFRPYPIRVNNRDGSSGPYADAPEISWRTVAERAGIPDPDHYGEITTTTKLPRRVFEFSTRRMRRFVDICGPTYLCMQFANYIDHRAFGMGGWPQLPLLVKDFVKFVGGITRTPIAYIGTGPDHDHMVDRGIDQ